MNTTYSHAAPYIRHAVLQAAARAHASKTVRSRTEAVHEMFGLTKALQILLKTENNEQPTGIADARTLPTWAYDAAKEFLKDNWFDLGFEELDD